MKLPDSKVNLVKINVIALPLNKWKEKKITLNLDFNILRSSMIQSDKMGSIFFLKIK